MDGDLWYNGMNKEDYKISNTWLGAHDEDPPCIYNDCVGCYSQQCENCGWNPFVSLVRIATEYGDAAAAYLTPPNS